MGFVVGLFLWFSSLDLKVGFVEGGKGVLETSEGA